MAKWGLDNKSIMKTAVNLLSSSCVPANCRACRIVACNMNENVTYYAIQSCNVVLLCWQLHSFFFHFLIWLIFLKKDYPWWKTWFWLGNFNKGVNFAPYNIREVKCTPFYILNPSPPLLKNVKHTLQFAATLTCESCRWNSTSLV